MRPEERRARVYLLTWQKKQRRILFGVRFPW
jgi:hypothetical protein